MGCTWSNCRQRKTGTMEATKKVTWEYKGVTVSTWVTKETLDVMSTFQPRDDDIIVASYPKTGTHWIAEIVFKILSASGEPEACPDILEVGPMELTIPPATQPGYVMIADMPSPRIIMTHLPIELAPQLIAKPQNKVKVLVPMRNPKDTAVSLFHYRNKYLTEFRREEGMSWAGFVQEFMDGKAISGDYCNHLLGWCQMRDDPHFLFLKYEDMKKDLLGAVTAIAAFLEVDLDQSTLEGIAEASTFDNMKPVLDNAKSPHRQAVARKGIVGDWKNMFSPEQSKAFDTWYEKKLGGTGITFDCE